MWFNKKEVELPEPELQSVRVFEPAPAQGGSGATIDVTFEYIEETDHFLYFKIDEEIQRVIPISKISHIRKLPESDNE